VEDEEGVEGAGEDE